MKKTVCINLFLLIISSFSFAQGTFGMFTGRYDGDRDWQRYDTANFRIVFVAGLEEEAARVGEIAEQVYTVHRENLGLSFKKRYPIFINDSDDFTNAAAALHGYSFIWIRPLEFRSSSSGSEGWLEKVIAHEMVHALVFANTRSFWDFFDPFNQLFQVFGHLDFNEGLAQFYAGEAWGLERGDRYMTQWIRNEGLNDSLLDYGHLTYAQGFSKIKWLRQKLDDQKIGSIFSLKKPGKRYNFAAAFREATGQSLREFNKEWHKAMKVFYNWREGISERTEDVVDFPEQLPVAFISVIRESADGRYLFLTGRKSEDQPDHCLYRFDKQNKKLRLLARKGVHENFSIRSDDRQIAFSRNRFSSQGYISDIYLVEVDSGRETRISDKLRAFNPVFVGNGKLVLVRREKEAANLYECDLQGGHLRRLTDFAGEFYLSDLSASRDGEKVIASFHDPVSKQYGILIHDLRSGQASRIVKESFVRFPLFAPDGSGEILFTAHSGEVSNVFRLTPQAQTLEVTAQANYLMLTQWPRPDQALGVAQVQRDAVRHVTLDPNRSTKRFSGELNPYYNSWLNEKPGRAMEIDRDNKPEGVYKGRFSSLSTFRPLQMFPFLGAIKGKLSPTFSIRAADMQGWHNLYGTLVLNTTQPGQSNFMLSYVNRLSPHFIQFDAAVLDTSTRGYFAGKRLYEKNSFAALKKVFFGQAETGYSRWAGAVNLFAENNQIYPDQGISEEEPSGGFFFGDPDPYSLGGFSLALSWNRIRPYTIFPVQGGGLAASYAYRKSLGSGDYSFHTMGFKAYHFQELFADKLNFFLLFGFQGNQGVYPVQKEVGVTSFDSFDFRQNLARDVYVRGGNRYYPGNRLFSAAAELRVPIFRFLSLAAFLDGAYIWSSPQTSSAKAKEFFSWGFELQFPDVIASDMFSIGAACPLPRSQQQNWSIYVKIKGMIPH